MTAALQSGDPSRPTATKHVPCPHCHSPIPLPERHTAEVVCPGCGSSFRLQDAPLTTTTQEMRSLGRFQVLGQVGMGAFGAVWRARDPQLDRLVALKVMHPSLLGSPADRERFFREARAAAQLRHPGIVTVHEVTTVEGEPVIVSDFIDGVTLREFLQVRRLTFHEAAELVDQVADALDYAHAMGLVHRDVKPANIMIEMGLGADPASQTAVGDEPAPSSRSASAAPPHPRPLLLDFGLALRGEAEITMTVEGQIVGTPAYMSPEQAAGHGHRVDRRSDVYALGVVLYELLCGELPFRGSKGMLRLQVLHEEPRAPRRLNDKIPRDLETICLKAMAKSPARRYATARDLADDLRRFLKGEPIQARPLSAWERGWNWAKRRPAAAALLLVSAVAALALVGAGVALLYNTRLEEKNRQLADAFDDTERARQDTEKQRRRAEEALDEAKFYQYFHHIALAHAGWREGNLVGVDKLLDDCPSSQRNWEWHYLKRLCHAHSMVFGHDGYVNGATISPDGLRLACSGWDKTLVIVDIPTRKEIHHLHGHTNLIVGVAFSPDGQQLASSDFNGTIKVWEVATGREAFTCQGHKDTVWTVAFSPDGARLASASEDRSVRFWDAKTGRPLALILDHPGPVWGISFSPDGSRIVSGGFDNFVRLWEVATGRLVRTFDRGAANVDYSPVAFSPDGRQLAAADRDGIVTVWNATTGLLERRLNGHRGVLWSVTFSPNGHWFASAGIDQTVRLWDVASGQQLLTLKGHTMEVCRVVFHPDGSWLASASSDGTVRAWPVTTAQEAGIIQVRAGQVGSLAYSPDGARLAAAAPDRTVKIWDARTGQTMHTFTYQLLGPPSLPGLLEQYPPVAYSRDGSRIAAGAPDGTVPVWDTRTGQLVQQQRLHEHGVWALAYSPDGSRLASAGEDATILVWEAGSGRVVHELRGHKKPVTGLAFNSDGSRLASSSMDHTVMVWDVITGKALDTLRGHDSWAMSVAFSRNGTYLASGGNDNCAILWDAATGRQVRKLKHASLVKGALFSPDGQRLATLSDDGTIKVWEVATGLETLALRGHTTVVRALSFSPDGSRLASGSDDGTIRIWDARPWTREAAAEAPLEREALGLLAYLFTLPLRKADVLDYLNNTTSITPQARPIALGLVEGYREETDPERYHQASRAVVRQPYLNPFQYRFALRQAETACQLAPERAMYRTGLGAAQYRAGHYKEAQSTLAQADLLHRADPASLVGLAHQPLQMLTPLSQAQPFRQTALANLAFLAMAHHQLGQKEQAQAALARLREAVQQARWNKNEEAHDLMREAEAVIGAQGRATKE